MSEQDNQQEPTMEEILASIRRIISEDGEESDAGVEVADEVEEQPTPEPEPEPEPEEDVAPELEKLEEIDQGAIDDMFDAPEPEAEAEAEAEPEPEPKPAEPNDQNAADDIFDLTDEVEEEPEESAEPEEESVPEPVVAAGPDAIVSDDAEVTAGQSFADLSALMVAGYTGAGNTLEGLVREMLKPLLKAYLDENLPTIVKEMVEKEIARISRRN